jgi:hypothetical protein
MILRARVLPWTMALRVGIIRGDRKGGKIEIY